MNQASFLLSAWWTARSGLVAFIVAIVAAMAASVVVTPAFAQNQDQGRSRSQSERGDQGPRRNTAIARPPGASELLDQLAAAKDEAAAKRIAGRIEQIWERSGSDTADLLMSRAAAAMQAKDFPLAIELIDRAITLRPEWAEAYNKRATALFALGDYQRAMYDLNEVLRREPRHFNALAGVGIILRSYGEDRQAYQAFKRALAIHPHLEAVRNNVERLAPEHEGRSL